MRTGGTPSRAFTLVEMVMTIIVLAVVASVVFPVINATGETYAAASRARDASESAAHAIDRVVRLVREAPAGAEAGEVGIDVAGETELVLSDGRGVRLDGETLTLLDASGDHAPLCREVEAFALEYLGADGVRDTSGAPSETSRVNVTLRAKGFELRSAAFIRVKMGS